MKCSIHVVTENLKYRSPTYAQFITNFFTVKNVQIKLECQHKVWTLFTNLGFFLCQQLFGVLFSETLTDINPLKIFKTDES